MAGDNVELEKFRQQWKEELHEPDEHLPGNKSADTTDKSASSTVNQYKSNTLQPFVIADKLLQGQTAKESLTLTESELAKDYFEKKPKRLRLESDDKATIVERSKPQSLIDVFLNDLIEITEIPFFDLELSREVALKIFSHLDAVDLCRCCQVSRAWKNLAEDELLWTNIAHRLGYEENMVTMETQEWKQLVTSHVLVERNLQANWKSRTGASLTLQHVQGGVLCAVATDNVSVLAGYSSGVVRLWKLDDSDSDRIFSPSNSALVLDETAEQGTLQSYPIVVSAQENYVAASYSQGIVDLWSYTSPSSHPTSSFTCPSSIDHLGCSPSHIVASCRHSVHVHQVSDSGSLSENYVLDMGDKITSAKMTFTSCKQSIVVVALGDKVKVHVCGKPESSSTLHHSLGQHVACLDSNGTKVAVAVSEYSGSPSGGNSQKIKLYSMDGAEQGELDALACSPCCMDLERSPPGMLITGARDRRVRIYDLRVRQPILSLAGHAASITCVVMDDWKVVSGAEDGLMIVWDQRMVAKLWDMHNRHPVQHLHATDKYLVTANIPYNKFPSDNDADSLSHVRHRGNLHVYDFSVDQRGRQQAPDIIQSTFDEPDRYSYNVRLAMPYDTLAE